MISTVSMFRALLSDDGWEPVTGGESGAGVFRREDGSRYAKCVPAAHTASLEAERDRVGWLDAQGVPGPRVLDWRVTDEGACLVTSAVTGAPAAYLAKELELCYAVVVIVGAAASEQGNAIIAAMLKHLPPEHACACGQTMAAARERGLVGEDWQTWIGDHTHGH